MAEGFANLPPSRQGGLKLAATTTTWGATTTSRPALQRGPTTPGGRAAPRLALGDRWTLDVLMGQRLHSRDNYVISAASARPRSSPAGRAPSRPRPGGFTRSTAPPRSARPGQRFAQGAVILRRTAGRTDGHHLLRPARLTPASRRHAWPWLTPSRIYSGPPNHRSPDGGRTARLGPVSWLAAPWLTSLERRLGAGHLPARSPTALKAVLIS